MKAWQLLLSTYGFDNTNDVPHQDFNAQDSFTSVHVKKSKKISFNNIVVALV